MANAHRPIVRKVDRQAASNLLRAPGPGPPTVLPRPMPTSFPGYGRAGYGSTAGSRDHASQSFLHIGAQCRVEHELCPLRPTRRSLGVPLRRRCTILQTTTPGGSVAAQLSNRMHPSVRSAGMRRPHRMSKFARHPVTSYPMLLQVDRRRSRRDPPIYLSPMAAWFAISARSGLPSFFKSLPA